MVEIIAGVKGTGKTRRMLDSAEEDVRSADGLVVYIDKSDQRMLELNSKIRMIDMSRYPVSNLDGFVGFLCGSLSQNRDIQKIYLDSFLAIAHITAEEDISRAVHFLERASDKFDIDFIVSISKNPAELPGDVSDLVSD